MELTPQLLETQQFPEKWRGYDQDAVDEFLERVGVGLGQLQDRLRTTVSKLKELEAGAGETSRSLSATQSEPVLPAKSSRDREFSDDRSDSGVDVSAVARALVIAQEASDAALREAKSEGARITSDAKAEAAVMLREAEAEAKRLTSEAERRHEAATSRLDDADAVAAEKAEQALGNARREAEALVADAGKAAANLTAEARAEADRVTRTATEVAETRAAELAAQRGDELRDIDNELERRRREAATLEDEINNRQVELRSVVEGLQSLVGRVGSLTSDSLVGHGSADNTGAAEIEVPSQAGSALVTEVAREPDPAGRPDFEERPTAISSETVLSETAASEPVPSKPEPSEPVPSETVASETGPSAPAASEPVPSETVPSETMPSKTMPLKRPGAVVIDLTSDETGAEVSSDDAPVQRSPRWANVDNSPKQSPTDRRGLSVVGNDTDVEDATVKTVVAEQSPRRPHVSEEPLTSKRASSDRSAASDDPFLAALRGPDRAEFDDDGEFDPDQSSFKRRRRRRL